MLCWVPLAMGVFTPNSVHSGGAEPAALQRDAEMLLAASSASGRCPDQILAKLLVRCQTSPEPAVSALVAELRKQQFELARQCLEAPAAADRQAASRRSSALAELLCHLSRVRTEALRGSTGPAEVGGFIVWRQLTVRAEGDQWVFSTAAPADDQDGDPQTFWNPPAWAESPVSARPLSAFEFALPAKTLPPMGALTRFKASWNVKQLSTADLAVERLLNQVSMPQPPPEFYLRCSLRLQDDPSGSRSALGFLRGRGAWSRGEGRAVLAAEALTLEPTSVGKKILDQPACFVPTFHAYKHASQNLRVVDAFPGVPEAVPAVALVRYADGTYAASEKEDLAVGAGFYVSLLTVRQRLPGRKFVFDDGGLSLLDRTGTKTLLFARLVDGVLDASQGELRFELRILRSMKEESRWLRELLACPRIRVQLGQGAPLLDLLEATKDLTISGTASALGVACVAGCK